MFSNLKDNLVAFEQVAGVDLAAHVIQARVVAVRHDHIRTPLELVQVVHHHGPEERGAVRQRRLVHDHRGALGLHSLHHALDRRLAEVVGVRLHGQAVHAHRHRPLRFPAVLAVTRVVVAAGHLQHAVRDEVLARAVRLHDRLDQVLGHIPVVREQLLRVLRQAVAAVPEARIVVVRADARVQAHAVDDRPRVQPLRLRVRVQLVEVAHAQRQVRVREELDGLRLGEPHEQGPDVLLDGALLQQRRERARSLHKARVVRVGAHDDAARVQVVVQGLALAQELRAEDDVPAAGPLADRPGVADRDGGLDHHDRVRVDPHDQVDHGLHRGRVEEVLLAVVVCGRRDDHEVRVRVRALPVQCGGQVQLLLREVPLDVLVLDRADPLVDLLDLLWDDVHRGDMMVLAQQRRERQSHVTRAGNGNPQRIKISHFFSLHLQQYFVKYKSDQAVSLVCPLMGKHRTDRAEKQHNIP